MAFSKKTWKDRVSQYINRRLLTDSDGNTQQVTVTRDEGSVTEAGDAFSASNMNDLENRIEAAIPVKIQDLDNVNLTTSDNNKLLGVSVSGSDISVGAIGVKQKAISFQSSISGNSDKGYTISDILTQANVSSDKLISIEFGGARALTAWSEVRCTTWLSISGGTHGFYFHNFGTGGNAEFSFLVTYFE